MDGLRLAAAVARADEEVVGVAEHAAQVELDDVERLLVRGVAGDLADQPSAAPPRRPRRRQLRCALRGRARARRRSRRPRPDESSSGSPARARARTVDEEMSITGISRKRRDGGAALARRSRAIASRTGCRAEPLRAATARPASPSSSCGSRQAGSVLAVSAPTMNVSSACGWLAWMALRVSTVNDVPPRSISSAPPASPARPRAPGSHMRSRCRGRGLWAPLCGGMCAGTSSTLSSPSCASARRRPRDARGGAG